MNLIWPYVKIVDLVNTYGMIAIYEPHPFRSSAISEAAGTNVNTGISDDDWAWVYYDWCGNPVGTSHDVPEGRLIYKVKPSDIQSWYSYESDAVRMCEYLNMENDELKREWEKRHGFGEM